jgi:transcriptional regulator with XRE-family HTH domain
MTKKEFKLLRSLIGLSQGKLAKELGVTTRTITRWERGEFPIPRIAELALRNLFRESLEETVPWEKIKKDLGIESRPKKH